MGGIDEALRTVLGPGCVLSDRLLLTELQELVCQMILTTPAPGKHAARSAVRHTLMAWEIRHRDPEMAAFHALTAEEESATAVFHTLQRHRYTGSRKLNPRDHLHKNALRPFLVSVAKVLQNLNRVGIPIKFELNERSKPALFRVGLLVPQPDGSRGLLYPEPPLNFSASIDGKVHDFSPEIDELANTRHARSVRQYFEELANRRNRILYAHPNGLPSVGGNVESAVMRTRDSVFWNLVLYLLIDQHRGGQLFVQQCFDAFLKLLNRLRRRD